MFKTFSLILIALLFVCNSTYALKPVKEYSVIPDTQNVPYENNSIVTADNLKLKSWTLLPAKAHDNKITLVLAYADAGNMSWWIPRAIAFAKAGYTVLLFDYRGFGESAPFAINNKMLYYNEFATDLSAAVKFAREKYKGNKTGVLCYSMGSIIATLAAQKTKPDFIVGEGYVTDPALIKENSAKANKQLELPKDAGAYKGLLEKLDVKMLIFSGKQDQVTTEAMVMELKKKKPAINVISFNGGHMQGFDVLTEPVYIKDVNTFVK